MNEVSTRLEALKLPGEEKNLILKSLDSDSLFDIKKKKRKSTIPTWLTEDKESNWCLWHDSTESSFKFKESKEKTSLKHKFTNLIFAAGERKKIEFY